MNKNRLEAFSDGVIAIVITLLVLNLKVPKTPSINEIWKIRESLIAYISSFIFVVVIWQSHHQLLSLAKSISNTAVWANNFWLFWLTLSPFVTYWISEFPTKLWPAFCYSVVYFMWSLSYGILSKTLLKANEEDSKFKRILSNDRRSKFSLIVNILVFIGIFFWPPFAIIGRLIISAIWAIPYGKIGKY
ncbi:DUF1211 domain-containing protein [Miniphocaeibacter halophilus]|uniref:DUF1211 domain-containing protein n=2 Tax=Miniphocaeibacter halophilus TaxID=2931922 RepID=A0AC61N4A3_9FIRM|nr:DUF1211 domain-containing protein [Miniphocaeibacter halophilus]